MSYGGTTIISAKGKPAKLVRLNPKYWPKEDYGFWCPGCNGLHEVSVDKPNASGARWSFDGNTERPTFAPSFHLKVNTPDMGAAYQPDQESTVCHSIVSNGRIQFLGDCTHALVGQTVDLPDFPDSSCPTCERL